MNKGQITFKPYAMEQMSLLPLSLEELIREKHLVRVVNRVVEELDIKPLLEKYKGGGTSSYRQSDARVDHDFRMCFRD
jgi:transposase